mmetsp:Transcript_229/g.841  ORF Transcript_229/g.841 Transcript_229/m.841 type:complete len:242 (-) Transcript_229:646-1371(-)
MGCKTREQAGAERPRRQVARLESPHAVARRRRHVAVGRRFRPGSRPLAPRRGELRPGRPLPPGPAVVGSPRRRGRRHVGRGPGAGRRHEEHPGPDLHGLPGRPTGADGPRVREPSFHFRLGLLERGPVRRRRRLRRLQGQRRDPHAPRRHALRDLGLGQGQEGQVPRQSQRRRQTRPRRLQLLPRMVLRRRPGVLLERPRRLDRGDLPRAPPRRQRNRRRRHLRIRQQNQRRRQVVPRLPK